ncbi:10808_t:CDS:2 [Funneliformis mosseae]|uniref:10808_t:CDS:1 n=1 Tax=Funneliformis mosseae TaxID=27381 RepID=A0A9N9GXG0_FUNMO|nr:10808_t:CDS:2 [Funneliformis mosseae]
MSMKVTEGSKKLNTLQEKYITDLVIKKGLRDGNLSSATKNIIELYPEQFFIDIDIIVQLPPLESATLSNKIFVELEKCKISHRTKLLIECSESDVDLQNRLKVALVYNILFENGTITSERNNGSYAN